MSDLVIEKNTLVTISVRMFDLQGNLLEKTPPQGMTFYCGHEDIFPKVEKALLGKKKNDLVTVTLEPEDAFGEFDPDAIFLVDVDKLGPADSVVPGLTYESVPGQANDGKRYTVTEVANGKALLDANHPLAGYTLRFQIVVLNVEPVTPEMEEQAQTAVPDFLTIADKILPASEDEGDDKSDAQLDEELRRRGA